MTDEEGIHHGVDMNDNRSTYRLTKPEHLRVVHHMDNYPPGLKTAAEISQAVRVSEARLIELAKAGYCPHYSVDGGDYLFKIEETRKWIAKNLCVQNEGRPLPVELRPIILPEKCGISVKPPTSLVTIAGLLQVHQITFPPAVYFLCSGNEVIYVGQSTDLAVRVHAHNYPFDSVYFLPIPESLLLNVEKAFIR